MHSSPWSLQYVALRDIRRGRTGVQFSGCLYVAINNLTGGREMAESDMCMYTVALAATFSGRSMEAALTGTLVHDWLLLFGITE